MILVLDFNVYLLITAIAEHTFSLIIKYYAFKLAIFKLCAIKFS